MANEQKLLVELDILAAQPRYFSNAQPQTIKQREDHPVSFSSRLRSRIARQLRRNFEEQACLIRVEEEWPPRRSDAPDFTAEGRLSEYFMNDHPIEQSANRTDKPVVTARRASGARGHEFVDVRAVI